MMRRNDIRKQFSDDKGLSEFNINLVNSYALWLEEKFQEKIEELSKLHLDAVNSQRELLLDFAEYSENDKKSEHLDELVDNYLDSIKQ